jgi:hypothetical protein
LFCFSFNSPQIARFEQVLLALMAEHLPDLRTRFLELRISFDMFVIDWYSSIYLSALSISSLEAADCRIDGSFRVLTLFTKSLPLDTAARVWDMYFIEGDCVIYRTILGTAHIHCLPSA